MGRRAAAGEGGCRATVVVLAYGTVVHVVQLAVAGAAASSWRWRCSSRDAAANGWVHHVLYPATGVTAGRVGQGVITLLAPLLVATTPALWRAIAPAYRRSAELAASPNDRHASSSATRSATSGGSSPATTSARVTRSSTRR